MSKRDQTFSEIRHNIATVGVHITWVAPGDGEPSFAYTVGLDGRDHPEFITYDVNPVEAQWVLNNLAFRVRDDAQRFDAGQIVSGLDANRLLLLLEVRDSSTHLTMSNMMYRMPGRTPVRALQVVFPDSASRWPWEPGSEYSDIPLLGAVPSRSEWRKVALAPHQP